MESERTGEYMGETDWIAERLARGDPDAPRDLVERHHAELYRYARALMRDATGAEDVVQEAFGRAFAALGKYPKERIESLSPRPWLYRITLNVARNLWREAREPPVEDAAEPEEPPGADRDAWMDALQALGRLPERQRVAVTLRYLEDLPYAGISEVTGWPENTCKTLVRRGLGRLGALLSEEPGSRGGA